MDFHSLTPPHSEWHHMLAKQLEEQLRLMQVVLTSTTVVRVKFYQNIIVETSETLVQPCLPWEDFWLAQESSLYQTRTSIH